MRSTPGRDPGADNRVMPELLPVDLRFIDKGISRCQGRRKVSKIGGGGVRRTSRRHERCMYLFVSNYSTKQKCLKNRIKEKDIDSSHHKQFTGCNIFSALSFFLFLRSLLCFLSQFSRRGCYICAFRSNTSDFDNYGFAETFRSPFSLRQAVVCYQGCQAE